jgi:hypothetical protein
MEDFEQCHLKVTRNSFVIDKKFNTLIANQDPNDPDSYWKHNKLLYLSPNANISETVDLKRITVIQLYDTNPFLRKHIENGLLSKSYESVKISIESTDLLNELISVLIEDQSLFNPGNVEINLSCIGSKNISESQHVLIMTLLRLLTNVKVNIYVHFQYFFASANKIIVDILKNDWSRQNVTFNIEVMSRIYLEVGETASSKFIELTKSSPQFGLEFSVQIFLEHGSSFLNQKSVGWSKGKNLILMIYQREFQRGISVLNKFPKELIRLLNDYLK